MKLPKMFAVALIIVCVVGILTLTMRSKVSSKDPQILVVVPVYNVEKYLSICMDSLLNQTLRNIEIVCVDDGSSDHSGDILDYYARKDNRVLVIHQSHKGVSNARNVGLAKCRERKGEYVTFVDADDYIEKDTYRYIYRIAKAHDNDITEFGWRRFNGDGLCGKNIEHSTDSDLEFTNYSVNVINNTDIRKVLHGCFFVWNKLYKKELIEQSDVLFIEDMVYEDNAYNLMILPYVKRYECVNKICYNYRKTPGSLISKGINNEGIENCINAIPAVCNKWRQCNIVKGNENYLLEVLMGKYWWIWSEIAKNNSDYANDIAKAFESDIYNDDVVQECSDMIIEWSGQLEEYRKVRE